MEYSYSGPWGEGRAPARTRNRQILTECAIRSEIALCRWAGLSFLGDGLGHLRAAADDLGEAALVYALHAELALVGLLAHDAPDELVAEAAEAGLL